MSKARNLNKSDTLMAITYNFHLLLLVSFLTESGQPLDPCSFPVLATSSHWIWLMDLQRSLGVLIGRIIHGGMTVAELVDGEEICFKWLHSTLVQNGFEERDKLKGIKTI